MEYKLIITERAEELLDGLVHHLLYHLRNEQAAKHLLDEIEKIYNRLQTNPFQFLGCRDAFLSSKGYREAILTDMDYLVVFCTYDNAVYILGVFHTLEEYENKI